jgi:hypothetical protein
MKRPSTTTQPTVVKKPSVRKGEGSDPAKDQQDRDYKSHKS